MLMILLKISINQNMESVSMIWYHYCIIDNNIIVVIDHFDTLKFTKPATSIVQQEIPPYNGFGSEEDSLASCQQLIPKPPKRDFIKFMNKDRSVL